MHDSIEHTAFLVLLLNKVNEVRADAARISQYVVLLPQCREA